MIFEYLSLTLLFIVIDYGWN